MWSSNIRLHYRDVPYYLETISEQLSVKQAEMKVSVHEQSVLQ